MNFGWPDRAAGKAARRSAARVGLIGIAALTVAGAAALTAPAMSAMAATGTNETTTVINIPFPDTLPADTAATIPVTVTDDVAGGPAPTGTVTVTTAGAYNVSLPADEVYACTTAALAPAAELNADGLAYSTGTCTIYLSNTGVPLYTGFIEIVANYSGDDNNAPSNTDGTENKIVNLLPTNTTVTPSTATAGQAVTLKATVGPGNILYGAGSDQIFNGVPDVVTFSVNGAAACTNAPLGGPVGPTDPPNYAVCTVTLPAGTYTIQAAYSGDEYTAPSAVTQTLTVSPSMQATATKMSGASGYVGGKTTLAATVTGGSIPTGTVRFVSGGKMLCSASLSKGAARCAHVFTGVGSVKVEAVYGGDSAHKSSSSAVVTVKVTKQPTAVKVTASAASKGKAVKLTATVKSLTAATGSVTFYVNGHKVGTAKVAGGRASWSYTWHAAGTYKVTAVYGGNSTHAGSNGTASVKVG
jgi:large repetitive protein